MYINDDARQHCELNVASRLEPDHERPKDGRSIFWCQMSSLSGKAAERNDCSILRSRQIRPRFNSDSLVKVNFFY